MILPFKKAAKVAIFSYFLSIGVLGSYWNQHTGLEQISHNCLICPSYLEQKCTTRSVMQRKYR